MMTRTVKALYKHGSKNTEFLNDIWNADGDTAPMWYETDSKKSVFAAFYYGWLVAKHGNNWRTILTYK